MIFDLATFLYLQILRIITKIIKSVKVQMRKNLSKDYSKRPWKTPSPNYTNDMRSPRYLRGGLLRMDSNKQIKTQQANAQIKTKSMLRNFKNQLVQIKQEANKIVNGEINHQKMSNDQIFRNQDKDNNNDEYESYNSYFSKASSLYETITKNYQTTRNPARNSGFKIQDSQMASGINNNQSKYQDSLKRYLDQNMKLKQSYKQLEQNYNNMLEYNKKIEGQLQICKTQIEGFRFKIQEKQYREISLNQQINKLKDILQINISQLNNSNFEIYKMKQEIYQLNLDKEKKDKLNLNRVANDDKLKAQLNPTPKSCQSCKANQKTIISLSNSLENKIYQLGKKDLMITSLLSEIQRVQNELKMFEKPKFMFKKIVMMLDEVNSSLIGAKAQQLNLKYRSLVEKHR